MLKKLVGLVVGLLLSFGLWLHDREWSAKRYKYLWWWLDAVALILVVGFCASCRVPSGVRYEPVPVLMADSLPIMGKTVCDTRANKPVVFIRRGLSGEGMSEVVYHEMVHAKQALEYEGGCNALLRRYSQDRIFAYEVEAEAYCATIHRFLPPDEKSAATQALKAMLYIVAGRGIDRKEADAIVDRFCEPP